MSAGSGASDPAGGMRAAVGPQRQALLAAALADSAPWLAPLVEVHPTLLTAEQLASVRAALAHAVLGAGLAVDDELDERGEALHDLVDQLAPWRWGHS